MKIEVHAQRGLRNDELVAMVERRISFALCRFGSYVSLVNVSIKDCNGPKGGVDRQCRMAAKVAGVGEVVVEDADSELEALVNRASERLGRVVSHRLEKRRFGSQRISYGGNEVLRGA